MPDLNPVPLGAMLRDLRRVGEFESRPARKRTCLFGKLVYGGGAFTLDCLVRDISETGAKIVLHTHQPMPTELFLIVIKHCVAYQAKAMWVDFPARGFKFMRTYPLSGELPGELRFLRKLWGDLYMRTGREPLS